MLKEGKHRCNYSQATVSFFLSENERNLLCIADLYKTSILISYIGIIFIYIAMVKNKSQHQIKLCPWAGRRKNDYLTAILVDEK